VKSSIAAVIASFVAIAVLFVPSTDDPIATL
jgi:hypothetical protein